MSCLSTPGEQQWEPSIVPVGAWICTDGIFIFRKTTPNKPLIGYPLLCVRYPVTLRLDAKRIVTGYRTQSDDYPNAEKRKTSMNAGIFFIISQCFLYRKWFFYTQNATIKKARPAANYLNKQQPNKQKKRIDRFYVRSIQNHKNVMKLILSI